MRAPNAQPALYETLLATLEMPFSKANIGTTTTVLETWGDIEISYGKTITKTLEELVDSKDIADLIEDLCRIHSQKHYRYAPPVTTKSATFPTLDSRGKHIDLDNAIFTPMPPIEQYTVKVKVKSVSAGKINVDTFSGAVCSSSVLPVEDIVAHPRPLERYVVKAKIRSMKDGKPRIPAPDELT